MNKFPNLAGWLISLVLATGFFYIFWVVTQHQYDWAAIKPYWKNLLSGWGYTFIVSLAALFISTFVGIFLTIGQLSSFRPSRFLSRFYIEFVRAFPF